MGKNIEQVLEPARAYCELMEALPSAPSREFFLELRARLVALVAPANGLLSVESPTSEAGMSFGALRPPREARVALEKRLDALTGDAISRMLEGEEEPERDRGATMLFDDLADLAADLSYVCLLWEIGTPDARAEAAWELKFGYDAHWGEHLYWALCTVHRICGKA